MPVLFSVVEHTRTRFVLGSPKLGLGNEERLEDAIDAWIMMKNSGIIVLAFAGNMLSIAMFNFFGISVTKSMSATTRMVLDSARTVIIWGVSLLAGWETFGQYGGLQLTGFVLLLTGTGIYNKLIKLPCRRLRPKEEDALAEGLLQVNADYDDLYDDDPGAFGDFTWDTQSAADSEPMLSGNAWPRKLSANAM